MRYWFESTVSALTYSLVRQTGWPSAAGLHPNRCFRFVRDQWRHMPMHLRGGVFVLTLFFSIYCLFTSGKLTHRLAPSKRERAIERWRKLPLSFCAKLIRFYESFLALAAWREG